MYVMREAQLFDGAVVYDDDGIEEPDWGVVLGRLGLGDLKRLSDIVERVEVEGGLTEAEREEIVAMFAAADLALCFAA